MTTFPDLREVDLSHNQLEELPDLNAFGGPPLFKVVPLVVVTATFVMLGMAVCDMSSGITISPCFHRFGRHFSLN